MKPIIKCESLNVLPEQVLSLITLLIRLPGTLVSTLCVSVKIPDLKSCFTRLPRCQLEATVIQNQHQEGLVGKKDCGFLITHAWQLHFAQWAITCPLPEVCNDNGNCVTKGCAKRKEWVSDWDFVWQSWERAECQADWLDYNILTETFFSPLVQSRA